MSSGNKSLKLTKRISWRRFPRYAEDLLELLGGDVTKKVDTPVERIWDVRINGKKFWLSFNDFDLGVSLDSQDSAASRQINAIQATLQAWKDVRRTIL